jgi:hypothetical protein
VLKLEARLNALFVLLVLAALLVPAVLEPLLLVAPATVAPGMVLEPEVAIGGTLEVTLINSSPYISIL